MSIGAALLSVFPHYGPSSYTQVTLAAATIPTGGDTVRASEAGLKHLDTVQDAVTDDGIFQVIALPVAPSNTSSGFPGQGSATFILQWIANKTGTFGGQAQTRNTEAAATTDLSAFLVRLTGIGQK